MDRKSLQEPFRKLRKTLKGFPKGASPNDVHRLRTRIRRTEATAHALTLDQQKAGKRLIKGLKPARKAAGDVRDMDVLVGFGILNQKLWR